MRPHTTRAILPLLVVVVAALMLVPAQAFAVEAGPDEMVDPVGAMEPEIQVGEPVGGEDAAAQGGAPTEGAVQGVAEPAAEPTPSAPAGAPAGSGYLPFTGPEPGLLTMLLLVGLLALLAGVTAIGYGRALAESA